MEAASAEREGRPEQSEASESEAREGLCAADCRVSARVVPRFSSSGAVKPRVYPEWSSPSKSEWRCVVVGASAGSNPRTPHRTQSMRVVRTVGIAGRGLSDGRKEKGPKKKPQPVGQVCCVL